MPRGDRTGPYGEGPKTGRQMGYCVGNEHPGFINMGQNRGRGFGRRFQGGFGYGRGFGRAFNQGSGNFFYGTIPDVSEKTMIENEIRILKDQLSSLEERLSGIGEGK
ncbi:MAG: DUF5320 domain-containing protein [Bacteroidales bacterium]|nr:DUF5320 domain-containing protein [Bacteroidales bacterium]